MQSITILTTADPTTSVLKRFAQSLSQLCTEHQGTLTWIVVDGLGSYEKMPEFLHDLPLLSVQWITPGAPLPQLDAIMFGLKQATAPVVVMDADMHENLNDLSRFRAAHAKGAEMVFGWRIERRGIGLPRRIMTHMFNALTSHLLHLPLHDVNSPMVSLGQESLELILKCPASCPSPRLYACDRLKSALSEIPIRTCEPTDKKSTYSAYGRFRIGLVRLREILSFSLYKAHLIKDRHPF